MENNKFAEDRTIFVNRMESYLQEKKLPEALNMAEGRLSENPEDVDARVFVHRTLIEMGRVEESRAILLELEKDVLKLSFVFLRAAHTYREKGLNQDAVSCYQKFISLNPLSKYSREVAEKIALLEKKGPLAAEVDESDGSDMPKPEFYTVTLADLYNKQGHLKMAADVLTEIIRREPINVQARAKLDTVKAAIALKSSPAENITAINNLIKTLSCWLENIGRLKKYAT